MQRYILALIACGLTLTAALAQTNSPIRWSGLYFGAGVGFSALDATERERHTVPPSADKFGGDAHARALGELALGYDFHLQSGLVLGAFGGLGLTRTTFEAIRGTAPDIDVNKLTQRYALSLGARLGVPVLPATLLYVDGGYTHAGFKFAYSDDTSAYTNGHAFNGWFVGVGGEQRIARNMSLKLEYRNAHFVNQRVGNAGNTGCACGFVSPGCPPAIVFGPACVAAFDQATHYMEPSTNSVRLSVNFNLGQ
jgi:outer membrane immunogenic protein